MALAILIGLSLSDSAKSSPVSNNNQSYHEFSKTYGLGYDSVWQSVVQVFEQNNIAIKSKDKDSGIIVALDRSLPSKDQRHSGMFNAEDFDCGEPGRFQRFSKTTGTFTVIVKETGGLTTVQVEASGKALVGNLAGMQEQWRNCSSNGILEDKFLELQGRNIFFPEPAGMNLANQARENEDDLEKSANKPAVNDPLEGWNRFVFKINDKIYFWALKPTAKVYAAFIPLGLRTAIDNAARNFEFPARFANCVLQKKGDNGRHRNETRRD